MPLLLVLRKAESWEQKHNETRYLIPDILDQLGEHNTKLTDLQEALHQVIDDIRETATTNNESIAKLQVYEVPCSLEFQNYCILSFLTV